MPKPRKIHTPMEIIERAENLVFNGRASEVSSEFLDLITSWSSRNRDKSGRGYVKINENGRVRLGTDRSELDCNLEDYYTVSFSIDGQSFVLYHHREGDFAVYCLPEETLGRDIANRHLAHFNGNRATTLVEALSLLRDTEEQINCNADSAFITKVNMGIPHGCAIIYNGPNSGAVTSLADIDLNSMVPIGTIKHFSSAGIYHLCAVKIKGSMKVIAVSDSTLCIDMSVNHIHSLKVNRLASLKRSDDVLMEAVRSCVGTTKKIFENDEFNSFDSPYLLIAVNEAIEKYGVFDRSILQVFLDLYSDILPDDMDWTSKGVFSKGHRVSITNGNMITVSKGDSYSTTVNIDTLNWSDHLSIWTPESSLESKEEIAAWCTMKTWELMVVAVFCELGHDDDILNEIVKSVEQGVTCIVLKGKMDPEYRDPITVDGNMEKERLCGLISTLGSLVFKY